MLIFPFAEALTPDWPTPVTVIPLPEGPTAPLEFNVIPPAAERLKLLVLEE